MGNVMKVFVLFHSYFDGCECWENPLGYYTNEDLADYLQIELAALHVDSPDSFFVREIILDNSLLEEYAGILQKLKEKF